MARINYGSLIPVMLIALLILIFPVNRVQSEILNNDELGSIEIIDMSVIEEAAGMYTAVGLFLNKARGGPFRAGDDIYIYYHGQHDKYVSILDYSPDRKVKPLVMNVHTVLGFGELERTYQGVVNEPLGREYILMVVSHLPLTDSQLEEIALAPNEIEFGELIISASVNDFYVIAGGYDPTESGNWSDGRSDSNFRPLNTITGYHGIPPIALEDVGETLDYSNRIRPSRLWTRIDNYSYPWLSPTAYIEQYGLFSNVYYTIPVGVDIRSNFWNYATSGWIDDGIWFIPPGGYWSADFEVGGEYFDYYMRILPYIMGQQTSYSHIGITINGMPVGNPVFDMQDSIGWGQYWDDNPFQYYYLQRYLRPGVNTITLYWPGDENDNLSLQMVDILPETILTVETETSL